MIGNSAAWLAALVIVATCIPVEAQHKSVELAVAENRIVSSFEEKFPTWTRSEVLPIEGSYDVVINKWTLADKVVGITVVRYSSEDESLKRIRHFAHDMKAERNTPEDADEEYSLTPRKNSVTLKKRHFIIYIHVTATDPEEEKQLLKQFAKIAIKAVKH